MVNQKYKYRGFRHKYGGVRRDEKKKEILNPADIAWYAGGRGAVGWLCCAG